MVQRAAKLPLWSSTQIYKLCQSLHLFVMATMNISLADHMKDFAKAQTRDGRCSIVSDYMHDLIHKDQERKQAIAEIQALVD
jgi:hypothetical protein